MAKMVGFSRNIKLSWLNKTVELVEAGMTETEIKEQLNEYLSFEITSPTNLRKTREILMYIWVYENESSSMLKSEALRLIQKYPEDSLEIHWCMILATYPVFRDVCRLIGKMSEFQGEITLSQIKQKLFDEWGERSTLFHTTDKMVATMKALGVISSSKPGKYHIEKIRVTNKEITAFMVYARMLIDDAAYYTYSDLGSSEILFPFSYEIEKEALLEDQRFTMNNFGGELSVSLQTVI